jgi:hypothetical protein
MRGLLVMGIPYQHAPEVSIVRTDTCSCSCSTEVRHSRRGRMQTTGRLCEEHQGWETETRGGCCLDRFVS